jgi:LysM repeat protein
MFFKHLLNNILILLINLLFLLKKIIVFIFTLLKKIIVFIFNFLFFKIIVKTYYNYILLYKKIKEINKRNNSRLYLAKKNISFILLISLSIILALSSIGGAQARGMDDQIHQTTLAKAITSEFENLEQEELIVETVDDQRSEYIVSPKYMDQVGVIKSNIAISTDIKDIGSFVVPEQGDALSGLNIIPEETPQNINRREIIEYSVQAGDTISSIAQSFGVSVNTILWENNLTARSLIRPGLTLKILPGTGIMHSVTRNESISSIASRYSVDSQKIIESNDLDSGDTLKIGQKLFIPEGRRIVRATAVTGQSYSGTTISQSAPSAAPSSQPSYTGGKLLWPTVGNRITQYYSWRHQGLDIANRTGTPLYAAESGVVERSGWNTGYGYNVVINHGGGLRTLYAHASRLHVRAGDRVNRGDIIADMGSTGWSTGPHIHFEVILNGVKQNPLNYLR